MCFQFAAIMASIRGRKAKYFWEKVQHFNWLLLDNYWIEFLLLCLKLCIYVYSKIRSHLNYYILKSFIFILIFRWIFPSRLLFGRLTAHLKGGRPGALVG
jgi:hypothetical protein